MTQQLYSNPNDNYEKESRYILDNFEPEARYRGKTLQIAYMNGINFAVTEDQPMIAPAYKAPLPSDMEASYQSIEQQAQQQIIQPNSAQATESLIAADDLMKEDKLTADLPAAAYADSGLDIDAIRRNIIQARL